MKRLLFFYITCAIIFSCSKDDDSKSINVVGKWKALSQEQYDCTTASSNITRQCEGYGFCVTIEFKQDQTYQMTRTSDGGFVQSGIYSIANQILSLSPTGAQTQMYSFSLAGNTLTMTYNYTGPDCKTKTVYQKL